MHLSHKPIFTSIIIIMKVWYHDESDEHCTAAHNSTGEFLTLEELKKVGVLGYVGQSMEQVDAIAKERGYVARDEVRLDDMLHRILSWNHAEIANTFRSTSQKLDSEMHMTAR